jgi:hypothetical protein
MLKLTLFAALFLVAPSSVAAALDPVPNPASRSVRVRAADSRSKVLLRVGLQRSETLRALVRQLETRDVIVYIEMQPLLRKRLAGMLTWIASTVEHRYVRISLNPELSTDAAIATLGHELQHALEIANASEVVSDSTMEKFYRAHGEVTRAQTNGWDTEAARVRGDEVRRELAHTRSGRVADSIQQFEPED